jgi:hypothetical protein
MQMFGSWRENILGRQNSKYKGPKAEVCFICLRNSKQSCVARAQRRRERVKGDEVGVPGRRQSM